MAARVARGGGAAAAAVDGVVGRPATRVRVSEMQRSRLLGAAVIAVEELGWAQTTVAQITGRARVSRRTFYDLFENREECLGAVLEDALARIEREIDAPSLDGLAWRERVRLGLWRILCFFDREPALARLCVVQSARGSQSVLERREAVIARLAGVLDEGRAESAKAAECPPLVAQGLVGAALSIVHSRLLARGPEPLNGLLGELMGLLVLPYLGAAAARRERARTAPGPTPSTTAPQRQSAPRGGHDPLQGLPMRLTYRTARVLEAVAEHPGVSNRRVGELVEVSDQGQLSKLLARLERLGLLENTGQGHSRGEPNAWQLTDTGVKVAQSIRVDGRYSHTAGASR